MRFCNIMIVLLMSLSMAFSQTDTAVIYFDIDQYSLTSSHRAVLDTIKADSVMIIGYADTTASVNYNLELGRKRATSVGSYLAKRSIHNSSILSRGESQPKETLRASRKVEVISYKKEAIAELPESPSTKVTEESWTVGKEELVVGNTIVIKRLHFQGGRHYIMPESVSALDELLRIMRENPTLKIKILGHVCCSPAGTDGYDFDTGTYNLSENRAKAIYFFLEENGIDRSRITYRGMKGDYPLVREFTDEHRKINRRVEFEVVDI